jgi:hypothetical protein
MGYCAVVAYRKGDTFRYEPAPVATFTKEMALSQAIAVLKALGYWKEVIHSEKDKQLTLEQAVDICNKSDLKQYLGIAGYLVSGGDDDGERSPSNVVHTSDYLRQKADRNLSDYIAS